MFDKSLLRAELVLKDISLTELAKKLDINKGTLSKKMSGKSEWTLSEIKIINEIVGKEKTVDIFLL